MIYQFTEKTLCPVIVSFVESGENTVSFQNVYFLYAATIHAQWSQSSTTSTTILNIYKAEENLKITQ